MLADAEDKAVLKAELALERKKKAVLPTSAVKDMDAAVGTTKILLPYQANYIEQAKDEELIVVEKSRRIGLTWAEAADDVLYASTKRGGKGGGDDVNYIGPSLDMAREFIQACGDWAKAYNHAAEDIEESFFVDVGEDGEPDKHIKAYTIRFASGNKIQALSSAPRSLRGRRGRVVIDEAAFHNDLAEILKAAIALIIWGASVRVISTHDGVSNAFNELIKEIRSGRREGKVIKITFDKAIEDGLYERICLVTGKEPSPEGKEKWIGNIRKLYGNASKEELDCIPSKSGGKYIPLTHIESCMKPAPVLRWSQDKAFTNYPENIRTSVCKAWCDEHLAPVLASLDKRLEHVYGSDFARSGDQSVIWVLAIQKNLVRETPFVVELDNIPFDQQREILFYIIDGLRLKRFKGGAMDARGNGSYLAEVAQQKYGSSIVKVHATEVWYMDNMPPLKAAFESKTITVPDDADLQTDIHMFEEVKGVGRMPTSRTKSKSGDAKRHGDGGIACVNAYFASRQDSAPIEHEEGEKRQSGMDDELVDIGIGFGAVGRADDLGGFL